MPKQVEVVETAAFLKDVRNILNDDERKGLREFLAANPKAGAVIPGSGGVRKLRWSVEGKGKRGGGRVIYFYHDDAMPLHLFKFYKKAAKENLTSREKNALSGVVKALVKEYKGRK